MKKKGYDAKELIDVIGKLIDHKNGLNVAVIGMGNLGRAITTYFIGKRPKLNIVAAFDVDSNKVNRVISGINCYHVKELKDRIKTSNISIAIITSPPESAASISETLVMSGIKGILNFTTTPINVPESVFLEEFDMITSIEKVAYFVKDQVKG